MNTHIYYNYLKYISMIPILISNQAKMPIYVQVAKEFKDKIAAGELKNGDPLPGRQALARHLGVNINTINHAYRILENEGYIYSRRGIGSFVNPKIENKTENELVEEIREQLNNIKAKALVWGWTAEDFVSLVHEVLSLDKAPARPKAVFAECDIAWTDHLAARLQNELGLEVRPAVLPDRKTNLNEAIQEIKAADFVITTHVHFDEIQKIAGRGKLIFPLDMHLSYELLAELGKVKDARIGVPFLKPVTVKRLDHWIKAVGFAIELVPLPCKNAKELVAKSKQFKTIMATEPNVEKLKEILPEGIRILTIKSVLGEQSVQHLKRAVVSLFPASSMRQTEKAGLNEAP